MTCSNFKKLFFFCNYQSILLQTITFFFIISQCSIKAQNKPFPQQVKFPGCIKPSNVSQESMNMAVISNYQKWKLKYLKKSDGGEIGKGYYIDMKGTGGAGTEATTSEAHGYGMIIFALMAGFDDSAKIYFDGMVNLFDSHRSIINHNLMSWVIDPVEGNSDGATDGDMDIAYSLILAYNQWGNNGDIHYKTKADSIINFGIKGDDVRTNGSKRTTLGDWDNSLYNTRPSDWMAGHMKAYHALTNDGFWLEASDTIYSLIAQISTKYSSTTGLMPDFVVDKNPAPAEPDFLEAETDGDYSWNACRFPWRIAVDYAHYGTSAAKEHINKMLTWLKNASNDSPEKIIAGYKLDGSEIQSYSDMAFTAPFIASCVCDATHQEFLNKGWNIIKNPQDDYYGDSIGLLCMLFISGNWWKPEISTTHVHKTSPMPVEKYRYFCNVQLINSILTVQYKQTAQETVKFSLLDLSGRKCKEIHIMNSGRSHSVSFNMNALGLQPGIYLLNVSSPSGVHGIPIHYNGI